jgi:hypothetical protein
MKNRTNYTLEAEATSAPLQIGDKQAPEEPVFDLKQQRMLQEVSDVTPSKIGHFKNAYCGSLRSAITAKCLECVCFEANAIRDCTATGCPLYVQRPYQKVVHHA